LLKKAASAAFLLGGQVEQIKFGFMVGWIDQYKSMRHQFKNLLKRYSFYLGGDQPHVPWIERIRSVFGALIGMMLVLTIDKYLGDIGGLDKWLMASLGAMPYWFLPCQEALWPSPGLLLLAIPSPHWLGFQ